MKVEGVEKHARRKRTKAEGQALRQAIREAWDSGMRTHEQMADFCRVHQVSDTGFIQRYLFEMGLTGVDKKRLNAALSSYPLTEEDAYFLGLMMADGCVVDNLPGNAAPRIELGLASRDVATVAWVASYLGIRKESKVSVRVKSDGTREEFTKCSVSDRGLADRLARYGVVPRKSMGEVYHSFENPRVHAAFLRGELDGDGCVTHHKSCGGPCDGVVTGCSVVFMGGAKFVTDLRDDLVIRLGVRDSKVHLHKSNARLAKVAWQHPADIVKLYQYIYPDGTKTFPCMARKMEKFTTWFEQAKSLPPDPKNRRVLCVPEDRVETVDFGVSEGVLEGDVSGYLAVEESRVVEDTPPDPLPPPVVAPTEPERLPDLTQTRPSPSDGREWWEDHWRGLPEFKQGSSGAFFKLTVRFESQADVEDFCHKIGQKVNAKTRSIWHPKRGHRKACPDPVWGEDESK